MLILNKTIKIFFFLLLINMFFVTFVSAKEDNFNKEQHDTGSKEKESKDKKSNFQKDKLKTPNISEETPNTANNFSKLNHYIVILSILSILLAIAASIIAFWLYRWRTILIDNQRLLIPETLIMEYQRQNEKLEDLSALVSQAAQYFQESTKGVGQAIEETNKNLMTFQAKLNAKDDEISRYREGFDFKIYKSFIGRYFRVFQLIDRLSSQENVSQNDIKTIQDVFKDAFEESGVELFYPSNGADFIENNGLFEDNPKLIPANDPENHNKVAKVLRPGLRTTQTDQEKIIIKSKVAIYVYREEQS